MDLKKLVSKDLNLTILITIIVLIGIFAGVDYYQKAQQAEAEAEAASKQTNIASVYYHPGSPAPSRGAPAAQPQIVTASDADYARLEQILPQNEVIQALPDEARILLSFFNFNTGERTWERDYLIEKGSAVQVSSMPDNLDMKMIMHSRNVPILNGDNLCDVIATAKANGDYATELVLGKTKLLWKYKGVMGYKSCLGL